MSQASILEVRHLSVSFTTNDGIVDAVKDVNFELYKGETLAIVGESGSGKSVSTNALMQLLPNNAIVHSQASIVFEGEELLDKSEKQMRSIRGDRIGMIFQEPMTSLNPYMRVGIQVAEAIMCHRRVSKSQAKQRVLDLFELVHMPNPAQAYTKYPHEFSGGQRQRIGIARTIALQPQLIVCDESVSALDISVQAQVLNLLNELKEDFNFTYIFISHDLAVVKYMSDQLLVMNKGEIEELNDADVIYNQPKTEYTKTLINAIPKGL